MATRVVHWKAEKYDIFVGRPTVWGNPYTHRDGPTRAEIKVATVEEAIEKYEIWIRERPGLLLLARQVLRGKVLGCWCKPGPCHGDVLARIAEEEDDGE